MGWSSLFTRVISSYFDFFVALYSQLGDLQEVVKVGNAHPIELLEDENCDNSDPCLVSLDITPSQKIPLVPVAQDQTPRSPLKTKRSDTKNSWKKLSSKKVVKPPDSPENTKDSTYDQDHNFGVLSFDELRSELPFYSDGEFSQDVPTTKGHYKDGKEELQNKAKRKDVGGKKPTTNSPQGSFTDDALQRKEKGKKDGRRKLIAEKSDNKGKTMYCDEVKEKNKGKKNGNSTVYKKLGRGSWQKPLRAKKSESDLSDQNTLEDPENEERKKSVEALVSSQNGQPKDTVTLSETEVSKQNSAAKQNDNQPLGDLSFLINVNSQISTFVSDPSQQECVLDPMTAKERHEVYKLTHLYKLRARIGSKTENSLTTVHLSKQYDTQMPKPGRVDFLLSELSVNASKEAEKESFKGKMKRRSSTSAKENEDGTTQDDLEQDAPPKKKLSRLSRGKKV